MICFLVTLRLTVAQLSLNLKTYSTNFLNSTFEPNPNWSGFYAGSKEIHKYLQHVVDKYGVHRFTKLRHKVTRCVWNDNIKKWKVTVEKLETGAIFEEEVDIVVNCRGALNEPSMPKIPGLETFDGQIIHSALWKDESVVLGQPQLRFC